MKSVSSLASSRFLKKEDCGENGIIVTVKGISDANVAKPGQPEDIKTILNFVEPKVKPMVLNSTNGNLIKKINGKDDMETWGGTVIELYNDPSIFFAGEEVGGIRVRKPSKEAKPAPKAGEAKTETWEETKAAIEAEEVPGLTEDDNS